MFHKFEAVYFQDNHIIKKDNKLFEAIIDSTTNEVMAVYKENYTGAEQMAFKVFRKT